ncbi:MULTISPECIES: aromatase/cyclase [unclassified Streptomyces]|uniref:aromatase/cyclase n=1 Tax=unclassified Streptomyces TaxID=2593676 RepID=UPI002E81A060|nr:aromatase/cyclase [Streptomyces sp. NBC_00589]WTI38521.1 aromatase/cyclase [Streptomyces sp. NBC_00775]WUB27800.1 aromatase/cyclase [Streptomyces sp. NBC_00589]
MPQPDLREVEHEITVSAPAATVYRLIADVDNWPRIYPRTVYAEQVPEAGGQELVRIWATTETSFEHWTALRTLDPEHLRITFRPTGFGPPLASMDGGWVIEPLSPAESRVRLLHAFSVVDNDPGELKRIDSAVDRNSRTELADLKKSVEEAYLAEEFTFSFEDTARIAGSAEDVYDFVNEAQLWAERLPHVTEVRLDEDKPGLQTLETVTRAPDGSTQLTRSHRVCLPHRAIAYRQVTLPALLSLHTGSWTFEETATGVAASARHTVVLNTANITAILGPDATVTDARAYVRDALGGAGRAVLAHAKRYAERGR